VTALITVRQGGSVIACDRGCYNAKHPNCDCQLCGGVNHGIGLERATANTRRLAPKWVEAAGEGAEVELDETVQQDPLFTIGDHPMEAHELPTFKHIVTEALKSANAAADWLRSDWHPDSQPTDKKGAARSEAAALLGKAIAAMERASW